MDRVPTISGISRFLNIKTKGSYCKIVIFGARNTLCEFLKTTTGEFEIRTIIYF